MLKVVNTVKSTFMFIILTVAKAALQDKMVFTFPKAEQTLLWIIIIMFAHFPGCYLSYKVFMPER